VKIYTTSFGLPRKEGAESGDSFAVKAWEETVIAVMADGVGGARDGKEASARIVGALIENYQTRPTSWTPLRALSEFTNLINRTLYQDSLLRYEKPELVSTLAVAVIEGNRLFGLNVGDSPVYVSRSGRLERMSEEHVQPGMNHVLNRAIGLAPDVEPHVFETELEDGDLAFLCTDGVSKVLSAQELEIRLGQRASARALVHHAHELASDDAMDDMSAIVIDVAQTGKLRDASELRLPIPDSLQKGQIIDGYELIRPFQHSDRVWLATHEGQRWTLKFAPLEARDREAVLHHFVKETWNATRVGSDHFVNAFVPEGASARYYVMEFVEAPSLKTVLRARRLAVDETIALGKFLIDAETTLLGLGLIHGDIKPENILVVSEYDRLRFKLVDLGNAAEIFSVTSRAGTASYLAPERFRGAPVCERTESYSIGVTLYQSLCGTLPYGEIERFQTPAFGVAKSPSRANPNIPPWLDAVLLRALAVNPERRYRHYSELSFELSNPEKVEPFFQPGASILERNPLLFYKAGFWVLLIATVFLLFRIVSQ
jgi:serine/threonine protein phosphatase PrpC